MKGCGILESYGSRQRTAHAQHQCRAVRAHKAIHTLHDVCMFKLVQVYQHFGVSDEGACLKHGREQRQALRRPSRLNEKVADAGSRDAGAESSKGPGLY